MSEEKALVALEQQLKTELEALGGAIDPPSSNRISTKGKLFSLPDGRSGPGPIQVIVLDFVTHNSYYKAAWNPNVKAPPSCWAIGKNLEDLKPSDKAPEPQHTDCANCPKGQFGSATNGGKGKACKNTRKLLLVEPGFTEASDPLTLDVSPTGLKSWNKYVDFLRKAHAMLPMQVVTQISFNPNESYPSLQFEFVERHANVELAMRLRNMHADILWREPEIKAAA